MDTALLYMDLLFKEVTIQWHWHVRWIQNAKPFVTALSTDLASFVPNMVLEKVWKRLETIGNFVNWIQVRCFSPVFQATYDLI